MAPLGTLPGTRARDCPRRTADDPGGVGAKSGGQRLWARWVASTWTTGGSGRIWEVGVGGAGRPGLEVCSEFCPASHRLKCAKFVPPKLQVRQLAAQPSATLQLMIELRNRDQ